MENTCLIVSGGKENNIKSFFTEGFDKLFVLACDKGFSYAVKQGIRCHFVCGDFDSYQGKIPDNAEVLPRCKDDTDTMHGIKTALEKGFSNIILTCAGGGRVDHFISNLQALVYAKNHGASAMMYDDSNIIQVLKDESVDIPNKAGYSLSVLAYSDSCEGVSISGTEYEIQDAVLKNEYPLGQSNAWKEKKCRISVKKGILLVIMSRLEA